MREAIYVKKKDDNSREKLFIEIFLSKVVWIDNVVIVDIVFEELVIMHAT